MSQSANAGFGRKMLKIAGIVIGCFLGLILLATVLLLTVLEPYAERFIKKQVAESTEGLYSLDFEDIRINLLTGTLVLQELTLAPDSSVHRQQREAGEASPLLIEVEAPRFEISGIKLIKALISNQIDISRVILEDPLITLVSDDKVESKNGNDQAKAGKGKGGGITDFMESLEVGEIHLQEGTFRHMNLGSPDALRHEVPHISLRILDFRLDSLDQSDYTQMVNADDIQVTVENYEYHSPDSVYKVQVGLFSYSAKQGELQADSVYIHSDHEVNVALRPDDAIRSIYDIEAPRLRITGLDVVEAYKTKKLQMNQILLENASLQILQNTNIPSKSDFPDLADHYKNISAYLEIFEVGEFRIADGSMVLQVKIDEVTTIHELEKVNLALQDISIDSLTLFSPRKDFYAEAVLASVENYRFQHPHSPHTVEVKRLELSTRDKYLQVDSLRMIGDWDKNDQLKQTGKAAFVVYNLDLPLLRVSNFDPIEAYKSQRLDIGRIYLQAPSINMLNEENVQAMDFDVWLQETYGSLSDHITKIQVGEIKLQDGSFLQYSKDLRVKRIQQIEQATLLVSGLEIDSVYIHNLDGSIPLEEMVVQAQDYTYWLPDNTYTFKLGRLRYSTRTQDLSARSVNLISNPQANFRRKPTGKANPSLYDLSASSFRVTGLDLIKAFNQGQLAVNQVILRQPDLVIFRDHRVVTPAPNQNQQEGVEGLFETFNVIKANTIRMVEGTFTYREKREDVTRTHVLEEASATITGLALSKKRLGNLEESLPIQEMILTANDYTYRSPDGIYMMKLDSLHYSSRQQVLVARSMDIRSDKEENIRLINQNLEEANRNLFDISAQKFRINGFDLVQAYETGRFIMEEMVLTEPEVTILQDKNVPQPEDQADNAKNSQALEQVAELVEAFRVERLRVNDGKFELRVRRDSIQTSQSLDHVSVAIDQLRLVSLEANDPLGMFAVDEVGVLVRDYTYLLPDSLYEFGVKEIRTSLRDQTLIIDSLRLIPLFKKDEYADQLQYAEDRFDIHVPLIKMEGLNMEAFFNNRDIIMRSALVLQPMLDIYRDNRLPPDPARRPITLQNMLRKVEYYIKVDTIRIEKGKITYSEIPPAGEDPGVLTLGSILMEIVNVTNDSVFINQNPRTKVNASTQLMGESQLQVEFVFHLDHPEDLYSYEGTLESMDFSAFNPLFEKIMFVRIASGQINKVKFLVKATEHLAEGQMNFYYNNLKIKLIDKDNPGNPGFLLKAGTWLINNLAIKSNNPTRLGKFREGDIEVERDYQKSVFNHMSSAMMSGIISSLMPSLVERIVETFVGDI